MRAVLDPSPVKYRDHSSVLSHCREVMGEVANLELLNKIPIYTCIENFPDAVLKALAASTPMSRLRGDTRPPIPAAIHVEIRLKNRRVGSGRSQGTRFVNRGQSPAEVCDPTTQRVEERKVECDTRISRSRRPIVVKNDQVPSPCPIGHPRGCHSLRM